MVKHIPKARPAFYIIIYKEEAAHGKSPLPSAGRWEGFKYPKILWVLSFVLVLVLASYRRL